MAQYANVSTKSRPKRKAKSKPRLAKTKRVETALDNFVDQKLTANGWRECRSARPFREGKLAAPFRSNFLNVIHPTSEPEPVSTRIGTSPELEQTYML